MAGYPLALLGKLYGWHQTILLLQLVAIVNLIIHSFTTHLNKNMVDLSKIE